MAWLAIAAPPLWPWAMATLALGLATGALTCRSEGPGRTGLVVASLAGSAALAFAVVVSLAVVPGRIGLWLELGLALLVAFGVGCGLGCLARRLVRA